MDGDFVAEVESDNLGVIDNMYKTRVKRQCWFNPQGVAGRKTIGLWV